MDFLIPLIAVVIFAVVLQPLFHKMLLNSGHVRLNYKKESIPVSMGIAFVMPAIAGYWSLSLVNSAFFQQALLTVMALAIMSFAGFIDDAIGSRDDSGLKGHLVRLVRDQVLTTGAAKALTGGFLGLYLSFLFNGLNYMLIPDSLLIALSINSINLFDLRPGRAIKGFMLFWALALLAALNSLAWTNMLIFSLPVIVALLLYMPRDLSAKCMMGDAGSNPLGVFSGLCVLWFLPYQIRLVFLTAYVVLHLLTERYSLTKIIEKNRILKFFDDLGREK